MSTDEIRTTHTIIPAAPGWFVAKLAEYCEPFFEFHPIVAWEVEHGQVSRDRYRIAVPVLPCGLTDGFDDFHRGFGKDWALKSPDGKYSVVGEEEGYLVLDNEDDALAWFVAQHERPPAA